MAAVRETMVRFYLPWTLRISAVGMFVFFSVLALHALRLINLGVFYLHCVRWGSDSEAYELMICTIYLVWSVFLWRCARDPLAERTFLDFTVTANAAHFVVMTVQSFAIRGEQHHLLEDVSLGWLLELSVAAVWLPVRGAAGQQRSPGAVGGYHRAALGDGK